MVSKLVFGISLSFPFKDKLWQLEFLPARRYATAGISCRVCAYVCVSVCLPHAGIVSKRLHGSSLFFGDRVSLDLYYTLCFREIRVSSKIRVLPSGTLSPKLWT